MVNVTAEWFEAVYNYRDQWVPANGGHETPIKSSHGTFLYVFNPRLGKHGWLNVETDIVQMESPYSN